VSFQQAVKIVTSHVQKGAFERRDWDKHTAWYLSEYWVSQGGNTSVTDTPSRVMDDPAELSLETNYPYAFLDTMIANVVPSNPRVTLNPRVKEFKEVAKARQALINDTFRAEKLHSKAWEAGLRAGICGRCFAKVVWDEKKRRPVVRVVDPRRIFFDQSTDWEDIRYIIEAVPLTESEFKAKLRDPQLSDEENARKGKIYDPEAGENFSAANQPEWMYDRLRASSLLNGSDVDIYKWVIVYEYYDLVEDKFFHFLEGGNKPLIEGELPYRYVRNPFVLLVFNSNLRDSGGHSDVKLIERAQERLNEIDTLELWYAHVSIPKPVLNEALLDEPEEAVNGLQDCDGPGKVWRLKTKGQHALNQIIDYTRPPSLNPSWDRMRDRATQIIEFTLGLPQYQRGQAGTSDVATDLALIDTATRTRNGRRIKIMRDWIVDIGARIIGLWKEYLPRTTTLYVREKSSASPIEVDRAELAFPNNPYEGDRDESDDDWAFELEAAMDNPSENNRMVQLQKLQQFAQLLVQNPNVDQTAFIRTLCELLEMEEIVTDTPQGGQVPPGQAPVAQGSQMPAVPEDPASAGGLPPGLDTENILPPGARAAASQPKVHV
jgi:hypothetical protein